MLFPAVMAIVTLVIVWMMNWVYRWRYPSCNGKLPPGSMGLPLLGETLQFFKPVSSFDIHPFVKDRMKRYGSLFKTSLVGCPVIVTTDPDISHFIFQEEGKNSFEFWYADTFMKLLGRQKLSMSTGVMHKYLRNMIMDHFSPLKQKEKFLLEMEDMARSNLYIWSKQESIEVKEAATTMSFDLSLKKFFSHDPSKRSENLKDKYANFFKGGLFNFPYNIPGTLYHKCLKDQRRAISILKDLLKDRLVSAKRYGDFLDVVIEEIKKDEALFNIESAAYFLYTILFASFETVALTITLAINFISEHPFVLKDLMNEHEEILRKRKNIDSSLTWNEYKSMTFTSHVIDETLRLANINPLLLRRATRDVQIEGYTIPAGWMVMVCPPALHLNPEKYSNTLDFNPWRWKGQGSNTASKNFMAFGGGMRLCAGAEFAKLQVSVVLHFLVTKYRWTKIKGGEVIKAPGIIFPNGLHIKITEK